jgi:hypothetical protein
MQVLVATLMVVALAAATPAEPASASTVAAANAVAAANVVAEIEDLLAYVRALPDAHFIRNGKAHSAEEAEAHLRLKWRRGGKRIRSAEDFIRYAASASSMTGKPYLIRFGDGREVPTAELLGQRLREYRDQEGQRERD